MLGPVLEGSIVTLAPIGVEHLENFCRWLADPRVTRFLARDTPLSLQEEQVWFEQTARSEHSVMWSLLVHDEHVGSTGISQIDWRNRYGTTGILIGDPNWWGHGVAGEAMRLRTRYAFEQLGLEKLVTRVVEGNFASRRALESVGYQTVGVHRRHEYRYGKWWDVWVGELLRDDWWSRQPTPAV